MRDGPRRIAEQPPAPRDFREQLRPILESGAANHAGRRVMRREALQRLQQLAGIDAAGGIETHADVGSRERERVVVAEAIGHERNKSRPPRRGRQRAAGHRGDEHGPLRFIPFRRVAVAGYDHGPLELVASSRGSKELPELYHYGIANRHLPGPWVVPQFEFRHQATRHDARTAVIRPKIRAAQ